MTSKNNAHPILVLLDSTSLKSESSKALLRYYDNELFEFASFGRLENRAEVIFSFDDKKIEIDKSDKKKFYKGCKGTTYFNYRLSDVQSKATRLNTDIDALSLACVLSCLTNYDAWSGKENNDKQKAILVTERKVLLNKAVESYCNLPPHSIFHPDKANIFIDLNCKTKGVYLEGPYSHGYRVVGSKFGWHLYSMKLKLQNLQLPWSVIIYANSINKNKIKHQQDLEDYLSALWNRTIDMLMAIDEIGMKYYLNEPLDFIIYHFNYWLILFTGIIENLAWITKYRFDLNANQYSVGLRIKRNTKSFHNAICNKSDALFNFIQNNEHNKLLIELLYDSRHAIAHNARMKGPVNGGMLYISKELFHKILDISGETRNNQNSWGHIKSGDSYFLETFSFVKMATTKLIEFADEYLRLLNFEEYLIKYPEINDKINEGEKLDSHKKFIETLEKFKIYKLGF